MITHHFCLFLSSMLSSIGVFKGTSSPGDVSCSVSCSDGIFANTPVAISNDVRLSSGSLVVLENQPPGKNREDVVDS